MDTKIISKNDKCKCILRNIKNPPTSPKFELLGISYPSGYLSNLLFSAGVPVFCYWRTLNRKLCHALLPCTTNLRVRFFCCYRGQLRKVCYSSLECTIKALILTTRLLLYLDFFESVLQHS